MNRRVRLGVQILWPAFLVAGMLETVVFAWVDPSTCHFGDWHPDAKTVYSLMFLIFWVLVSFATFTSHWLTIAGHTSEALKERQR
jgi:hypothetical protein